MVVVDCRADGTFTVVHNDEDFYETVISANAVERAQEAMKTCAHGTCELFFTYDAVSALLMQVRGLRPGVRSNDIRHSS